MKIRQRNVCHTCRHRKLGCDGRQPNCTQCESSGRKCEGYQYDLIFADPVTSSKYSGKAKATSNSRVHKAKKSPQRQSPPVVAVAAERSSPVEEVVVERAISSHSSCFDKSFSWTSNDITNLVIHNFVPREEISGSTPDLGRFSRICGSWLQVMPKLSTDGLVGKALTASIKAFAIAIMAKGSYAGAATSHALVAHCSALQSLQHALVLGRTSGPNELAAAIMCLFLSEVILPTNNSSDTHAIGLSFHMQALGPKFYSSGVANKIFNGSRGSLVVQSICYRRATFLATEEWRTIPFERVPATPLQDLLTVGTFIPALLESADRLNNYSSCAEVKSLMTGLKEVRLRLDNWKTSFRSPAASSHDSSIVIKSEQTPSLWFTSITAANGLTHYWAFWLICTWYIQQLKLICPEDEDDETYHTRPDGVFDDTKTVADYMAVSILQSVQYLTQDDMKLFGATSLAIPVKVAYEHIKKAGDAKTFKLCEVALQHIRSKHYYYLSRLIEEDYAILRPLQLPRHRHAKMTAVKRQPSAYTQAQALLSPALST